MSCFHGTDTIVCRCQRVIVVVVVVDVNTLLDAAFFFSRLLFKACTAEPFTAPGQHRETLPVPVSVLPPASVDFPGRVYPDPVTCNAVLGDRRRQDKLVHGRSSLQVLVGPIHVVVIRLTNEAILGCMQFVPRGMVTRCTPTFVKPPSLVLNKSETIQPIKLWICRRRCDRVTAATNIECGWPTAAPQCNGTQCRKPRTPPCEAQAAEAPHTGP